MSVRYRVAYSGRVEADTDELVYEWLNKRRQVNMLFEVAVVEQPTKKDAEENDALEKLVYGPKFVVAKNPESAGLKALRSEEAKGIDVDKSTVLIRSFT